ncbi:MAG: diguanylate cyclase [Alphaproteobacteria bacterium]|nr:diguanylate cyclase [Alphaproteobacteria bacterium]MBF0251455.1 diguanylate cyclase [Alphaproteobacteria bacterium]
MDSSNRKGEGGSEKDSETIREATILQSVINAIPTPIFFKDAGGRYLGCNKAFEQFVGRPREELVGKDVFELWDAELAQVYHDADAALYDHGGKQFYEAKVTYADGMVHDVVFHKAVFFAEEENISGIVGAILDITDRKKSEAELERMARTDALTGLANRHILYELLDGACRRARRGGKGMAVLALDLDGFKAVNDVHGHHAGDAVLQAVAGRLKETVRETDVVARLGGDEFIVVLEGLGDPGQAALVARHIVEKLADPIHWNDITVAIGVSIGIALYGKGGDDVDSLMQNADMALYTAKDAGKGGYAFY